MFPDSNCGALENLFNSKLEENFSILSEPQPRILMVPLPFLNHLSIIVLSFSPGVSGGGHQFGAVGKITVEMSDSK